MSLKEQIKSCLFNPKFVKWARIIIVCSIALAFIIIVILSLIPNSPVLAGIFKALEWIENLPIFLSMLIFIELYGFIVPFGCPITPLALVAGYLFGPFLGPIVGIIGALVGATVCYTWALTLLKSWAEEKVESKRIFKAIYYSVKDQSFKLIVICRLSPILPSAVLNYLFATMGVSYPMFLFATLVGVTPLAILYAYIGSLAENLTSAFNGDSDSLTQTIILLCFFILSTILLVIILGWIGKREITKALKKLDEIEGTQEENERLIVTSDEEGGNEIIYSIENV